MQILRLLVALLLVLSVTPTRAETLQNHFASVFLSGEKIGSVHFTTRHDAGGVLQELKTRSSLSIFGREVYHYSLHTHELWEEGNMKRLWGTANENGVRYQIELDREPGGYSGILNGQAVELPANSFPTAVWHYAITQHTTLFSLPQLNLLNVNVKKSEDSLVIGETKVDAEKYKFTGDWKATIWFDSDGQFLKWQYKVKGRTVTVVLDP